MIKPKYEHDPTGELDVFALEKGDELWESCQYGNLQMVITSVPKIVTTEIDGKERRSVEFFAKGTYDDDVWVDNIRFYLVEGWEIYGPKLCAEPSYGYFKDGQFSPWKPN